VLNKTAVGGAGGYDYVFADAQGRKLYVPRGNRVEVYDLDTLKSAGTITPANAVHGVAVDSATNHGFCSSAPVVMWDTQTLKVIKTIDVKGRPDGILFDPFTEHVLILSHSSPNVTAIDAKDGTVKGTLDLGGEPEQGASDGKGKLYISLEDKGKVAVVDAKEMKVTGTYELSPKGGAPAGLAMDVKNRILFVSGRSPATCVVMNADTGEILATLPIGDGVDAMEFNPETMEAFVSSRDGKLTVIKESDPRTFAVEQTVATMAGARTSTLDAKTGRIYLIANDAGARAAGAGPATAAASTAAGALGAAGARGMRGRGAGGIFTILTVGKAEK
jgi:DNA-binding beta-propeller fold protein YncE